MRFTVRRPPTGEVSPCGHRPSGGDVACSVDVGVAPSGIAGLALENRLALTVSGRDVPKKTSLRRERGRYLLDPAESFVLQTCDELAPAASADRAVEPAFLDDAHPRLLDGSARGTAHRPHIESLDSDHVEPPREVSADTGWHRSRQPKSHPPDLRHPYPSKAAVQPVDVIGSQPELPKSFVYTGFSPCREAVCAVEEVPHGLREIAQRLLLNLLAASTKPRILGARLRQLRGLLQIAGSLAAGLPVLLLLHGHIPHIPCIPAVRQQCLLLRRGRQQPEPRRIGTVTATTDISCRRKPAPLRIGLLPVPTSRVSSPRGLK